MSTGQTATTVADIGHKAARAQEAKPSPSLVPPPHRGNQPKAKAAGESLQDATASSTKAVQQLQVQVEEGTCMQSTRAQTDGRVAEGTL